MADNSEISDFFHKELSKKFDDFLVDESGESLNELLDMISDLTDGCIAYHFSVHG